MAWQQLIVHENELAAHLAVTAVESTLDGPGLAVEARNFERARQLMKAAGSQWSLVVVSGSAPQSLFSKGGGGGAPARQFVRELKASLPEVPVIALVAEADPELTGFLSAYGDTALIPFDLDWRDRLAECAAELAQRGKFAQESVLELEIDLHDHDCDIGVWSMRRRGPFPFSKKDFLIVDPAKLRELHAGDATTRQTGAKFLEWMERTSERLSDCLFRGPKRNMDFWGEFVKLRADVGGTQNTRIRFTLGPQTHHLMVEALKDTSSNEYWMLKAPIVRQHNMAGSTPPLFHDLGSRTGPIHCLVIEADPLPGDISDETWISPPLPALEQGPAEAAAVLRILRAVPLGQGVGAVEHLRLDRRDPQIVQTLFERLADPRRPWHLVHFIGHGVTGTNGQAGLVLAALPGGVVSFGALTAKLAGTQFLFVSSCSSASTAFLSHPTRDLVPATLGYRWPVEDAAACNFARHFYEALFKPAVNSFKSLEYAFLRARQAAYGMNATDVTWASPLLLTQLQ